MNFYKSKKKNFELFLYDLFFIWKNLLFDVTVKGMDIFRGVQRGGSHNINKPKMSTDKQCRTSFKFNQLY